MALRVLLADESSTIKKVIQLSLQDFGVDVKSVTIGLDVLAVAKTFRPDLVLADVLLAKRSGYEVCHDLKNDPETSSIPVVLMWSGFMEIDEQKARLCGADRRLEKPFDASMLRQIVQELVSSTQNNPVSSFMQFPPLPPFEESKKDTGRAQASAPQANFQIPISIPGIQPEQKSSLAQKSSENELIIDEIEADGADEWVQQPIAAKNNSQKNPQPQYSAPDEEGGPLIKEDEFTEYPLTQAPVAQAKSTPPLTQRPLHERVVTNPNISATTSSAQTAPNFSEEMAKEVYREEIQKWLSKNMPDIAERLIRDEINRLLQESEKTIQSP